MPLFKVKNEWDTVRKIIDDGASIARYGDGEIHLAEGANAKAQYADQRLAIRLRGILKDGVNKCLIGIPNIYEGVTAEPGTKAHGFWTKMAANRQIDKLFDPSKQYYSSFITRPDNCGGINTQEYFDLCRQMWTGRNVVYVTGQNIEFCKNAEYMSSVESVRGYVYGPVVNAWNEYNRIFSTCCGYPKDTLFLIRLGPTATVLAYDLCAVGYQALDLGHFGMFHSRFIEKNAELQDYDNSKTGKDFLHAS